MSLLIIITNLFCYLFSTLQVQIGLLCLDQTLSPETTAETAHTLRKCASKANLNLNTQGLMECEKSACPSSEIESGTSYFTVRN